MAARNTVDPSEIRPDAPLRLRTAAALAFPDGTMTESGLRREFNRGRLDCEKIAGKLYTTLNNIERMRILCRESRKVPVSTSANAKAEIPSTSSSTERQKPAQAAALMIAKKLKKPLPTISAGSTGPTGGKVIQIR